ncbi:NUDIX hydrolase domain-like [Phytophthora cinnamomi]|uniref:NUDIX hydrolase domain-like n=1 Tax=Phytophthora cinnamomi TaxID=4785 RepID=UPI00355AB82E|nr:NUDIX hydrolase domain-like [Phytophthora cinnamomi]
MLLPLRRLMSFTVQRFEAPLGREQVRVRLSPRFNRRAHPDAAVERQAAQAFEALQRQSPRLFNASKFRLQALHAEQRGRLQLDWGLTDYAAYLGTCCSTLVPRLLADGQAQGDAFAFLSRKVGVAAVLETADAHVALIQRSRSVGLYQDLLDTPGGHPEPAHVQLTQDALRTLEDEGQEDARRRLEDAARDEFFRSIVTEVHEEVNVAPQLQQPPELLGVVLQTEACTPSFSFHIKTQCSAEQLRVLYHAGPADKFESVKLELLPAEKFLAEGSTALDELKLTPSARGTLGMWREHNLRARQRQ